MKKIGKILHDFYTHGIEREKILPIRAVIWRENLNRVIITSVLMTVYYFLAALPPLIVEGVNGSAAVKLGFSVCALLLALFSRIIRKRRIVTAQASYMLVTLVEILAIGSGIYFGASRISDEKAAFFYVFMMFAQGFFIMPAFHNLLMPVTSSALFALVLALTGSGEYLQNSTVILFVTITLSEFFGWSCSKINIQNLIDKQQLKNWGNEIYYRSIQEYRDITRQSLITFANVIDAKDEYTKGHSLRVADLSREISRRMGLSPQEQENIYYAALLHDIGKVAIPDSILTKPGKLTDEEYETVKTHTAVGGAILKDFTAVGGIVNGALYHHERIDGKGYGSGLTGDKIPLSARIVSVADTYDALTSNRSYRAAYAPDEAVRIMKDVKGTQLDENIVDIAVAIISELEAYKDLQIHGEHSQE